MKGEGTCCSALFLRVSFASFFFFFNYLFIYFLAVLGLRSVRGLSLVVASGGHSSSRCAGLSLSRPLPLRSTGSRRACSVIVAHGPSCSAACGILPDQGLNLCPLHWQADSQPLRHQGSPSFASWCLSYFNILKGRIFWTVSLCQMQSELETSLAQSCRDGHPLGRVWA